MLRLLNGLIPHFIKAKIKGEVIVDGTNTKESNLSSLSLKVGMILENPLVQITGYGVTVEEEIAIGLENIQVKRENMKKIIDDVINLVDLEDERKRSPFDISGGQQQRLAIAGILAMKPIILAMDEPTNHMDLQSIECLEEALMECECSLLLVSHDQIFLEKLTDKCWDISSEKNKKNMYVLNKY